MEIIRNTWHVRKTLVWIVASTVVVGAPMLMAGVFQASGPQHASGKEGHTSVQYRTQPFRELAFFHLGILSIKWYRHGRWIFVQTLRGGGLGHKARFKVLHALGVGQGPLPQEFSVGYQFVFARQTAYSEALIGERASLRKSDFAVVWLQPAGGGGYHQLGADDLYKIPKKYSARFMPGWKFYNAHRKMFKPKSTKANQRALLDLLTGKNIFLAQEAWITLLKAKPSPLSEKFFGQLIPKLGPNRQAYFIYEMFDHRWNGFPAAVARLVVKATTSAQLIPPATACAYAFQWQRSSIAGAILQQINKKSASFGTHTTADKDINKLIRFAGLKPLNQVNP